MSDVTIKQLAKVLGTPVDKLLSQLGEAGMKFSDPEQVISSTEKVKLLGFLRRTHGKKEEAPVEAAAAPRQITLKRRTVSEITVAPGQRGAAAKTVNVEVRQKRTYVKRSVVEEGQQADPEREEAIRKLGESQAKREAEDQALKNNIAEIEYWKQQGVKNGVKIYTPTEAELESAAQNALPPSGNFLATGWLHPAPATAHPAGQGRRLAQVFGDVWEWSSSAYRPYPGFRPLQGALGEYNGKFMCNQFVVRGGSCVTPAGHIRPSYRNFFYPHDRWQFLGLRLARDA